MSRRWLLSLGCLSVLISIALLAPLTRARGELKVIEVRTRFLLEKEPAEVLLAVENSTGETLNAKVEVELRDPQDRVISQLNRAQSIGTGNQTLSLTLPLYFSKLIGEDRRILFHRLHYRVSKESQSVSLAEGIISLSEITPDLFELRVAAAELAREGGRYKARVVARHPVTHKPAPNVLIDAELTLLDDEEHGLKLHNSKPTNSDGYAMLEFEMPKRFPQYPHTTQYAGGELKVVGKRGAFVAEAEGDALVDQSPKTLITTDKPLYQPGQIMHVRALVFTPSRRALANQNILFKIDDPEHTAVHRSVVKSSRFGIASTEWSIPENVRLGDYRIHVMVDGGSEEGDESSESMWDIRISRYDLPNFSVTAQTDREYYLPGQNAEARIRADYLFGQPVKRGHVRVVRESSREWNYREQKWEVEEGEEKKGETDANGVFTARLDLSQHHAKLAEWDYKRFEDVTYAAYFTDPTTNRTEQRRFDVRVTRDPIHVYVVVDNYRNRALPLRFYVSTSYADGSPARCKVNAAVSKSSDDSDSEEQEIINTPLITLRTNRYGVAKASGVRMPSVVDQEAKIDLKFSATDSNGRTGKRTEGVYLDNAFMTYLEAEKTLYRAGEPITASIKSSVPDETLLVDLIRDTNVINTQRVRLRDGRASVTFPYTPEFKDRLTIASYPISQQGNRVVDTVTVLYPRDVELKVNARTSQTTYRPGANAHVSLNVRAPEGRGAESALSVVVSDKAVTERYRTTQEFGGNNFNYNESLQQFMGFDLEFAGVTLRDLQRLDTTTVISPDLDLVAEVMLNQYRGYTPQFFGGDEYDTAQAEVFAGWIKKQLEPLKDALWKRYSSRSQYPNSEASFNSFLLEEKIAPNGLVDPWGVPFRRVFSLEGPADVLTLTSAGADKRFGTVDDFSVERFSWRYFLPLGAIIDLAIRHYHERTGGFIRDAATLREELSKAGVTEDQLRDRWDQSYRFDFSVQQTNYVLTVSSSGPDKKFAVDKRYAGDDFDIWSTPIDYFTESREKIEQLLDAYLQGTKSFPQTDQELRSVLRDPELLRDPWGRTCYATFLIQHLYADRAQLESRANLGGSPTTQVTLTPVTQKVATINLRSLGPDGVMGTADDFLVASYRKVISEQTRGDSTPKPPASPVVLPGSNGGIHGVVTDLNGAVIPRATVIASQMGQERRFETSSDEQGKFLITDLPPGIYTIRFQAPYFKDLIITNVIVPVSGAVEVSAALEAGQVTETVTVTSGVERLMTEKSVSAMRLPVGGRGAQFRVITKSGGSLITTPHLREYFPETLLWQPSVETDKQGRARVDFKLADNITTWKLAVLGSTEDGLIGTAETEIKSFQPFFVEHDPPRVLTEGDEISLPVVVRNYLSKPQRVDLDIKPENWFALLGPAHKRTDVAAGDAARETFNLRAISSVKDGKQRLTAIAPGGNDAIEKPVSVHPDGEERSVTDSDILGSSTTLQLNLPENMIPNSNQAELKIYPNLVAHVIESVEAIMRRPYGCGEQVISSTYPSLLLLRQGKVSGANSSLHARAEGYLSLGYSKLLNYRDEGGGFTYWGHGKPDVALTAYALRFLTDASELIRVDEDVISKAQAWLIKQQQENGSWVPDHWTDRGSSIRASIQTAYIAHILASVRVEESKEKTEALTRAFDYLDRRAAEIDEPYLLASYALAALAAGDTTRAKPIVEKLATLAHREGGTIFWDLQTNTPFYGWGLAGRVETTALVVQALTRCQCESDPKLTAGALLFLLKQKDRYGVWYSTQATINVLDAMLSLLASQTALQSGSEATAEIFVNDRLAQTVKLPAVTNRLVSPITVDISKFMRPGTNAIRIKRPEGSPFASVQALANFYGPWPAAKSGGDSETRSSDLRLQAKCDKTEGKVGDEITCHVEAERVAFRGYGMMLAEIGIPPGADVDRSSLEAAMEATGRDINQYDVLPDRLVVYLWPSAGGVRFDFKFRPRFGLNAKSAASILYDYYNPKARAVLPPATFRIK
jgi:A-macroglobulin TED domain/Alpha-2-macroglobulin family/MG2 domain/Carboxypeptidase regulatory-like domain/A-macroglobulin receptor binding domain/Alpha-2-macroglobulin bait region domain/Macroglobulin domain MG3